MLNSSDSSPFALYFLSFSSLFYSRRPCHYSLIPPVSIIWSIFYLHNVSFSTSTAVLSWLFVVILRDFLLFIFNSLGSFTNVPSSLLTLYSLTFSVHQPEFRVFHGSHGDVSFTFSQSTRPFPLMYWGHALPEVHSYFSFYEFVLRGFANTWRQPKNKKYIPRTLQWTEPSKLLDSSNRSSSYAAWCSRT